MSAACCHVPDNSCCPVVSEPGASNVPVLDLVGLTPQLDHLFGSPGNVHPSEVRMRASVRATCPTAHGGDYSYGGHHNSGLLDSVVELNADDS